MDLSIAAAGDTCEIVVGLGPSPLGVRSMGMLLM